MLEQKYRTYLKLEKGLSPNSVDAYLMDYQRLKEYADKHGIDVVYFDAFAPEKQPEMWGRQTFERLYEVMNPGAILTTYCAKGAIRRLLQDVGFIVERIPGPPGGKREVLRATKKQERC